jgi:pyridinium-3,5-bisthiocarboxylic acid mononucleotide nickel chelatase
MCRHPNAAIVTDPATASGRGHTAWFNCCAGVAGDMLLGALVDAGADPLEVSAAIAGLGVDGYALTFEQVQRCGVRATWANVVTLDHDHHDHDHHDHHDHDHHDHDDDDHDHGGHTHPHRPAAEVLDLIARADLAPRVRERALATYRAIAEVEGHIHGIDPADVELHEVGALDSIIDVVGVCAALESLGIDHLVCSPIAVGHGTVDTAHGRLPNPVPAVADLLARAAAPSTGLDTTMELATPTGVALMTVLSTSFGPMPAITVAANGFGAGTADPPGRPNVVQVIVGTAATAGIGVARSGSGREARLVEANVDDVTGEVLAHTITALLAAGAHDAWATPIVMKKGRPAHTVHALCDDSTFAAVTAALVAETGTLGLRATTVERWPQQRNERLIDLDGFAVRVKVAGGRVKVEHDDAAAAAAALGLPLREVLHRVETRAAADGSPA